MQITLTLGVDDEDADEGHSTGLTNEAYERLTGGISNLGFEIVEGPDAEAQP